MVDAPEGVQLSLVTIGDYTLLQVTGQDVPSEQLTGKALCWLDDDYRYILTCPLAMTDGEILEVLDRLDRLN